MKSKGFKGYFEWSVVVLVVLLILSLSTRLTIGQEQEFEYGVFLNSSNATSGYTLNGEKSVSNDTGANTYGIFIDNDDAYTLSNLTINATLTVNQTNSVSENMTIGIYANGTFDDTAPNIPNIGNLTITENGAIDVSANGSAVFAGGVAVGNVTENLINNGTISVFGNVTDSSGQLMVGGVYAVNATNVVNNGNVTVRGTGGYVDYAENYVPAGFDIASLGNFTNTGNINVSIESVNATAVGVKSYNIGYFNNTGNISVFTNSTNGDQSTVIGVMAGQPDVFEGQQPGHIGTFVNNGTLNVAGYANGTELYAFGVAVFNGTIDEFQNLAGGRIAVYGNNIDGNATVYGVGEFSGDGGYGNLTKFINAGLLNATAIGSNATAFGVHADDYIANFMNEAGGSITVTANATDGEAEASGVNAGSIGNFTGNGTIFVSATASNGNATAFGITAMHVDNFINYRTIEITAKATNGTANAYGLAVTGGTTTGNFTNYANIKVTATGNNTNATGVYASRLTGTLLNDSSGNIQVSAQGVQSANATGVYVEKAQTGSTILNKGLIDVSAVATSGSVNSIGIYLKDSNATLTNNGTIKVYASGNVNKVAGIYLTNSNVTLSNFGEINVYGNVPSGANLRTLYIDSGSNVTLKDKFAITFGAPGTNNDTAPIYVASGSMLNLNNTVLVVRIWNNDFSSIVPNTPYALIEYNGTVNGKWGGLDLERGYANPLIDVSWYNANITDKDAMVIFKYNALNNPTQAMSPVSSITGAVTVNSFISGIVSTVVPVSSPLVFVKEDQPVMLAASAVSDMPLGYGLGGATYRGGMWFMPVYTKVKASDLGFDADAYGFNLGIGGYLTRDLSLGLYVTYSRTDIDYRITAAKSGDVDLFAVGMTGRWSFMKDAYLRFNVNGFKTNNDYEGRTGFNYEMKEKASYDVKGMEGEVMIGKVYRGKIALIPELGLKYNYYNPDSFWTKAYNATGRDPNWDKYYSPSSQHVWKVAVGVNVVGDTKWGGNPVRLYLMGRVEQALGKNEVEVINYMRGGPQYKLTKSLSKTTFVGQVGADVSLTKNFGVELSGRGDFNGDYSAYTGKAVIWYKW